MVNIKYIVKFYDPLPVLPGNEQDLGHQNIINTYLFYQVCKVHDIACFGEQSANAEKLCFYCCIHTVSVSGILI